MFVWDELRVEGSELELARECVVGQRFVSSPPVTRKKQIPRSARNDNLRVFQRVAGRRLEWGPEWRLELAAAPTGIGMIRAGRVQGRVGSGSRDCR